MELVVKKLNEMTPDEILDMYIMRVSVFIVEQQCPYQEVDELDRNAYHVFLKEGNKTKAYLRILEKGVAFDEVGIGRVISTERRSGLGRILIRGAIDFAKNQMGATAIKLEAQSYARKFYEDSGFRQDGEEFLEDGIPHIPMVLSLSK